MRGNRSREIHSILGLLRRYLSVGKHPDGAIEVHALDWSRVLKLSASHGVLAMVYRYLHDREDQLAPPDILGAFRQAYHLDAIRTHELAHEVVDLLAELDEAGFICVPVKGPVLADYAYGDVTLRPPGDIDLFVREADLHAIRDVLIREGFRKRRQMDDDRSMVAARIGYELARGGTGVELQWTFAHKSMSIREDLDSVWRASRFIPSLGERRIPAFDDAHLIAFLAVHGAKHHWNRLIWLCDIVALTRKHPDVDWSELHRFSREAGILRIVASSFRLADDLVGVDLPGDVREFMGVDSPTSVRLSETFQDSMFRRDTDRVARLERHLLQLKSRERLGDRLNNARHLVRLAFEPTRRDQDASLPLGSTVRRPFRVLTDFGTQAIRYAALVARWTARSE